MELTPLSNETDWTVLSARAVKWSLVSSSGFVFSSLFGSLVIYLMYVFEKKTKARKSHISNFAFFMIVLEIIDALPEAAVISESTINNSIGWSFIISILFLNIVNTMASAIDFLSITNEKKHHRILFTVLFFSIGMLSYSISKDVYGKFVELFRMHDRNFYHLSMLIFGTFIGFSIIIVMIRLEKYIHDRYQSNGEQNAYLEGQLAEIYEELFEITTVMERLFDGFNHLLEDAKTSDEKNYSLSSDDEGENTHPLIEKEITTGETTNRGFGYSRIDIRDPSQQMDHELMETSSDSDSNSLEFRNMNRDDGTPPDEKQMKRMCIRYKRLKRLQAVYELLMEMKKEKTELPDYDGVEHFMAQHFQTIRIDTTQEISIGSNNNKNRRSVSYPSYNSIPSNKNRLEHHPSNPNVVGPNDGVVVPLVSSTTTTTTTTSTSTSSYLLSAEDHHKMELLRDIRIKILKFNACMFCVFVWSVLLTFILTILLNKISNKDDNTYQLYIETFCEGFSGGSFLCTIAGSMIFRVQQDYYASQWKIPTSKYVGMLAYITGIVFSSFIDMIDKGTD